MNEPKKPRNSEPSWANFELIKGVTTEPFGSTDIEALKAFRDYLIHDGWTIEENSMPTFDLSARRGGEHMFVEAKTPKGSLSWDTLLGKVLAYATDPAAQYALVVPASSAVRLSGPSYVPQQPRIHLYEVDKSGAVTEHSPGESA